MTDPTTIDFPFSEETKLTLLDADVVIPAGIPPLARHRTKWGMLSVPGTGTCTRLPVVIFMHGSRGLNNETRDFQDWLASEGIASVAPNSFARPHKVTYQSPAPKDIYEKAHIQRAEELALALDAVAAAPWVDCTRIFTAGSSEGAVAVARHASDKLAGRILFSWSCEDNYFVDGHKTAVRDGEPVLNVISLADPYFSPGSPFSDGSAIIGHGGNAFSNNPAAQIVLVPGAPHTLYHLPKIRSLVAGFLKLHMHAATESPA